MVMFHVKPSGQDVGLSGRHEIPLSRFSTVADTIAGHVITRARTVSENPRSGADGEGISARGPRAAMSVEAS